ncbi:MAG TPA: S-layer homology domain-containing protein [Negativicutes bacterium]
MRNSFIVSLALVLLFSITGVAFADNSIFSDVPAKHWAYDAVNKLAKDGIIVSGSDRILTRYEMSQIVANALTKLASANEEDQALINKLSTEFTNELKSLDALRVSKVEVNQQPSKLHVHGDFTLGYQVDSTNYPNYPKLNGSQKDIWASATYLDYTINDTMGFHAAVDMGGDQTMGKSSGNLALTGAFVSIKDFAGFQEIDLGRQPIWGFGIGLFGRPCDADGVKLSKKFGSMDFTSFIANINTPPNESPAWQGQDNPVLATAQLGTHLSKNVGMNAGYYWSQVNGLHDYPGPGAGGNYDPTSGYDKSKGWNVATDVHFGDLTFLGQYTGTSLVNVRGNLPKNPSAWQVELTNSKSWPLFYPIVDLVDHTTVGQSAWAVMYYEVGPGGLPYGAMGEDWQVNVNSPMSGMNFNMEDNTKTFAFVHSTVVAKNTNLTFLYRNIKIKDKGVLTGASSAAENVFQVRLRVYY